MKSRFFVLKIIVLFLGSFAIVDLVVYLTDPFSINQIGILRDLFAALVSTGLASFFFFQEKNNSSTLDPEIPSVFDSKSNERYLNLGPAPDSSIRRFQRQFNLITNQNYSALRTESDSGINPPYDFPATFARLNIANFTTGYTGTSSDVFMELVKIFLERSIAIISRHGGTFKDFLGDEIIFYFKGAVQNTAPVAFHCLRDLSDLANEMAPHFVSYLQFKFYIRTSLSYGVLNFGPQIFQMNISGEPIIESAKTLAHGSNKERNLVVVPVSLSKYVSDGYKILDSKASASIIEFAPLSASDWTRKKDIPQLLKSKSDDVLLFLIETCKNFGRAQDLEDVLDQMTSSHFFRNSPAVVKAFFELLEAIARRSNKDEDWVKALTILVSLPVDSFSEVSDRKDFIGYCQQLFQISNGRLQANCIESIARMDPNHELHWVPQLFDTNNRLASNFAVAKSKQDLSPAQLILIQSLIKDHRSEFQASGFWALRQIISYYRENNPEALESDLGFQRLLKMALVQRTSDNGLIQRQHLAEFASELKKTG